MLIAVSSVGFAKARHMTAGAEAFVICTGYGLVQISVDAQGNPVEQTIPCPDCLPLTGVLVLESCGINGFAPGYSHESWPIVARDWRSELSPAWHHARAPPHALV